MQHETLKRNEILMKFLLKLGKIELNLEIVSKKNRKEKLHFY